MIVGTTKAEATERAPVQCTAAAIVGPWPAYSEGETAHDEGDLTQRTDFDSGVSLNSSGGYAWYSRATAELASFVYTRKNAAAKVANPAPLTALAFHISIFLNPCVCQAIARENKTDPVVSTILI